MTIRAADTAGLTRGRYRFGVWSVWIALGTLCVFLPIVVVRLTPIVLTYLGLEAGPDGLVAAGVRSIFAASILLAACFHGLGFVLGLVALFRRYDSRWPGVAGIILNAMALMFVLAVLGLTGSVVSVAAMGFDPTWM